MTTFDLENVANLIRSESQEIDEFVRSEGSYDLSDLELTNLTIRNGYVDDIELEGNPILELYTDNVVVDPDTIADLIVDKYGNAGPDQRDLLLLLEEVVTSCLGNSTTLIVDPDTHELVTMTRSNIIGSIVSQFKLKLENN